MRRLIPFALLGLLTVGAVVALVLALANAPSGSNASASAPAGSTATTLPSSAGQVTVTQGACTLVTRGEAEALLGQIVNLPPKTLTPYCSYEGIVRLSGSADTPTLTVTAVVDPDSVKQANALLEDNASALCGKPVNSSCAAVLKLYTHSTVDGVGVITRTSSPTVALSVASAITQKNGKVVVVTSTGVKNAEHVVQGAMRDLIPRL